MSEYNQYRNSLARDGFTVINELFNQQEVEAIQRIITEGDSSGTNFRKSQDLFAIRQVIKEIPALLPIVLNERLRQLIYSLFGEEYFIVKSIYFDKPPSSNWFVAWHQDLSISVNTKIDAEGFGPWTVKHDQFGVQPPLSILESNYTVRIHLDDTDKNNGALQVIPGSHATGICRPETLDFSHIQPTVCDVDAGGAMIMRPLLLHASGRTINDKRRRVLHIEFSNQQLPAGLKWSEYMAI